MVGQSREVAKSRRSAAPWTLRLSRTSTRGRRVAGGRRSAGRGSRARRSSRGRHGGRRPARAVHQPRPVTRSVAGQGGDGGRLRDRPRTRTTGVRPRWDQVFSSWRIRLRPRGRSRAPRAAASLARRATRRHAAVGPCDNLLALPASQWHRANTALHAGDRTLLARAGNTPTVVAGWWPPALSHDSPAWHRLIGGAGVLGSHTSNAARSRSEPADEASALPASTSTPASAVPCCGPTPPKTPGQWRSHG